MAEDNNTQNNITDLATIQQSGVKYLGQLVQAVQALTAAVTATFPRVTGSFTLAAAATLAVAQPGILATSTVTLTPKNAAAAVLQGGANAIFVSVISAGVGFTVATASGAAAAGTEQFYYIATNPS